MKQSSEDVYESQCIGVVVKEPPLHQRKVINILDQNGKMISIPYHGDKQTISELLRRYCQATGEVAEIEFVAEGEGGRVVQKQQEHIGIYLLNKRHYDNIFRVRNKKKMNQQPANSNTISLTLRGIIKDFSVTVDANLSVKQLKEIVCKMEKMRLEEVSLIYGCQNLDDTKTLQHYEVGNESVVQFRKRIFNGCFRGSTRILCQNQDGKQSYMPICQLKRGQQILSFDVVTGEVAQDEITYMGKTLVDRHIKITFENGCHIECTADHYFLDTEGNWLCYQTPPSQLKQKLHQKQLQINSALKLSNGQTLKVINITHHTLPQAQPFFHPCVKKTNNFILQNGLIAHNMEIFINISFTDQTVKASFDPSMRIAEVKKYIGRRNQIAAHQLQVFYSGINLEDSLSLTDYDINKGSTLNVYKKEQQEKQMTFSIHTTSSNIRIDKIIRLEVSEDEIVELSYTMNKYSTVRTIIQENSPGSPYYDCLLYGDTLIRPFEELCKLQEHGHFNALGEITIKVVSTPAIKFFFAEHLSDYPFKPQIWNNDQALQQEIQAKCEQLTAEGLPLLPALMHYSTGRYDQIMFGYLASFMDQASWDNSLRNFCSSIVKQLLPLPICYQTAYRRLFTSQLHFINNILIMRNILLCSTSLEGVEEKPGDVLLQIRSTAGRDIKKYSVSGEFDVAFLPYSYFKVQKMSKIGELVVLELTEVPTPCAFNKKMLVWVDDNPRDNTKPMDKIRADGVEVIQLTSTRMAENWLKQFGWLIHWNRIHLKIVSDMVRKEEDKDNYYAGIDLVQKIFSDFGMTIPVLIFCGNEKLARKNLEQRNLPKDRLYGVTDQFKQVLQFCKFE